MAPVKSGVVPSQAFQLALSGSVKLVLQFGGQGVQYWEELKNANRSPKLNSLIKTVAASLQAAATEAGKEMFKDGFDLLSWLDKKDPDKEYLAYSAVSYPLSGLTQMLAYYSTVLDSYLSFDDLKPAIGGAVGHSSGVCAALVASCANSAEELEDYIHGMVMYLFYHGVECQKAFNKVGGSAADMEKPAEGEAKPSPMLVVSDLSFESLSAELEKINNTIKKEDQKVSIGLINGPGRCVLVGPIFSMAKARLHLDKYQKNSGNDFVMDFLNTTMSFHSSLLEPAVEVLMKTLKEAPATSPLKKIAGMTNRDMKFPVYSTVDGKNLQGESNLLEAMCRMQSVQQLDWEKTTASLPDAGKPTFALDFGPGGARGVVALSTKIFKEQSMHFFCASKYTPFKPKEDSSVAHPKQLAILDAEEFLYGMPAMIAKISDCPFLWKGDEKKDISKGLSAFEEKSPSLKEGAFRSIPEAKKKIELDTGKQVKVITDVDNIFSWCRARFIDTEFDSKRKSVAGQVVQVIDTDVSDNTIKVKSGGTEVWIPIQAAMAA
eukprot:gnl/MRDRNA2_/MRDRNA2_34727_c0_seq1.p1 gnl/MRDRNA2_/MRDRNA2_34727_c0~~gnl/MRDRNA2_/MRDRNA2_34727_c0_seq1.p1  ORF type:complete len:570 (-),score=136.99 gnl/MRDRNA2_/MRDRNA2_34727_c0_seq1:29-1669(-)